MPIAIRTLRRPVRGRLRLAPLAVAALLAACATHEPAPRPEPELPASWSSTAPTSSPPDAATTTEAARVRWQEYFTDPRLQALIGLALANNRDLRIAAAKVEQGRAEVKTARAERLPSISGQVDQSHTYTPSDLNTGVSSQRFDVQAIGSYEFDFWGRVAALGDAARANLLASEDARREVQLTLITQVASTYYLLLEKDELIELARALVESREQSLEIVTQAMRIGGADEDERAQVQAVLESARGTLAEVEHQRNTAAHLLDFLVGRAPGDLPPGRRLAEQQPGVTLAPGVPSEVLLRRPDVMAVEQRLTAANADIDAARAAFMPKIMLTAALGFASPALAGLFSGGAWSYQPVMSMPIFDGGRTAAGLDSARARRTMLVADYEKTLQQAFREVADQLSARRSLKLQLDAAIAGQSAQASHLAIARARYEGGACSLREVLDAQRALLATRQSTITLRRAEQDSAAALYKALGGGTDAAPPAVVVAGARPAAPTPRP